MRTLYISGDPKGEHLRADMEVDGVHLVMAEYCGSKGCFPELRSRFLCTVPWETWLAVANEWHAMKQAWERRTQP